MNLLSKRLIRSNKDQPWSAQDERQIRGRAHRQPQKKEVICYHLLAEGTADMLLSGMAHGKHDMLEAFLSEGAGRGAYDFCFNLRLVD